MIALGLMVLGLVYLYRAYRFGVHYAREMLRAVPRDPLKRRSTPVRRGGHCWSQSRSVDWVSAVRAGAWATGAWFEDVTLNVTYADLFSIDCWDKRLIW